MIPVSIILINFNTFEITSNCIRSIMAMEGGRGYEIILVDNASTECDPAKFLEAFPFIKLIRNTSNAGFAAGNNAGIAASAGEYILLLNNDTLLQEDSVTRSFNYMAGEDKAGVLGCRMIYPDGKLQYSARRFRNISWELLDLFRFIPWLMSYPKRSRRMLGKYFRHDDSRDVDWVNGAFFLFPRKILSQLPGNKLDERFFMYGEDQLWCEQVRHLGYRILFFAGTTIIHIHNGSTLPAKQLSLRKIMMKQELAIMKQRKGAGLYYFFFKMIYGGKEITRNFIKSLVYRLGGRVVR